MITRPSVNSAATTGLDQNATQEFELFDDFTILPISAEFNSRSIVYLTLGGTLLSTLGYGSISQFFVLIVGFCLAYPTLIRYLSTGTTEIPDI